MNILVIAAHPDDEVLGCGGTIARLTGEGNRVHIAILGEGITSRRRQRDKTGRRAVAELSAVSRQAAKLLGAEKPIMYGLPDNRFDTVPLLDIAKLIEDTIEGVKPEIVYTHHGGDLNIDHAIVHRATLTATRPIPGSPVRDVYAYEVPSSTEWAFASLSPVFRPNVFSDISGTLERKIAALRLYETEIREFPHPRSSAAIDAIARRWGSVSGVEAAEAFELIRSVPRPKRGCGVVDAV
jgi:LmbE family N-acetylglucosaminyl deacetylase